MPISATDVFETVWKVVKEINERLQALSENDELRKRLERRIKDLKQVADDLKSSDIEDLPASCAEYIQKVEDSLTACKRTCDDLLSAGTLEQFAQVHAHKSKLQSLDKELEKAQSNLHFALTQAIIAQNRELKKCVQEGNARIEATVIHPSVGVYKGAAGSKLPRPLPTSKLNVTVMGNLLVIKWNDKQNFAADIVRYEVQYDDVLENIIADTPQNLLNEDDSEQYTFAVSLGHPKVRPGKLYTIQVRAVNRQGPGDWSERRVTRFKIGPPNKPSKPRLTVQSATEVLVEVKRLREKEENGSPVHQCVIEHISVADTNATDWVRLSCNISAKPVIELSIKLLEPDTKYAFRVKMINQAGESTPSEAEEIKTLQLIPGPPQELRASSMRLDKLIKVRWNEPDKNPHAVSKYEVQIQRLKKLVTVHWDPLTITEKLSAKATGLRTNTKYAFRVRAINNKNQAGEFSDLLQTETRYGKGARLAAATGAFLGGTLGGPLMGAVGMGYMAGSSASDATKSKAGKAAASTAAGIGGGIGGAVFGTLGAPLFGGTAAAMTYKNMERGEDEWSPQSSEDEQDKSMAMKVDQKK